MSRVQLENRLGRCSEGITPKVEIMLQKKLLREERKGRDCGVPVVKILSFLCRRCGLDL